MVTHFFNSQQTTDPNSTDHIKQNIKTKQNKQTKAHPNILHSNHRKQRYIDQPEMGQVGDELKMNKNKTYKRLLIRSQSRKKILQ